MEILNSHEEMKEIAELLVEGRKYTIVGHTRYGMPYHHQIIARKVEIVSDWYWRGGFHEIETLRMEVEHRGEKEGIRKMRYFFNSEDVLPFEHRFNKMNKGGFMIFEGWYPETTITKIPHLMYRSSQYNRNMPVLQFLRHIGAFDRKCLEIAKKQIGVEPIVYYMVDRGWLELQKWESRSVVFARLGSLNQTGKLSHDRRPETRVYTCKHGCSFRTSHRGAMNFHEHKHCKKRKGLL